MVQEKVTSASQVFVDCFLNLSRTFFNPLAKDLFGAGKIPPDPALFCSSMHGKKQQNDVDVCPKQSQVRPEITQRRPRMARFERRD